MHGLQFERTIDFIWLVYMIVYDVLKTTVL